MRIHACDLVMCTKSVAYARDSPKELFLAPTIVLPIRLHPYVVVHCAASIRHAARARGGASSARWRSAQEKRPPAADRPQVVTIAKAVPANFVGIIGLLLRAQQAQQVQVAQLVRALGGGGAQDVGQSTGNKSHKVNVSLCMCFFSRRSAQVCRLEGETPRVIRCHCGQANEWIERPHAQNRGTRRHICRINARQAGNEAGASQAPSRQ